MTSNLDPSSEAFLASVNQIQRRLATANSQVSSGKRIQVASDAPDQIGSLLQLRSNLQRNTQIQANLNAAQTEATSADNALSSAIQLMDTAITAGAQGANTTTDTASRQTIAEQIEAIQEQMVAVSQTNVQGSYIFSGDNDGSPTYSFDLNAFKGVDRLFTSPPQSTRSIEDPAGGSFPASLTAQAIFDETDAAGNPTSNNVFAALNNLRLGLLNNNTSAIGTALSDVKTAAAHLNNMQSFYGNVENRITSATAFASNYDTQLQTEIGQKQDADITSAAMELTQGNTALQAAMEVQGKMPHSSLFDFLA